MKRAAEIIHLLPENRKKYLEKYTNPSTEAARILWQAGFGNSFTMSLEMKFYVPMSTRESSFKWT